MTAKVNTMRDDPKQAAEPVRHFATVVPQMKSGMPDICHGAPFLTTIFFLQLFVLVLSIQMFLFIKLFYVIRYDVATFGIKNVQLTLQTLYLQYVINDISYFTSYMLLRYRIQNVLFVEMFPFSPPPPPVWKYRFLIFIYLQ